MKTLLFAAFAACSHSTSAAEPSIDSSEQSSSSLISSAMQTSSANSSTSKSHVDPVQTSSGSEHPTSQSMSDESDDLSGISGDMTSDTGTDVNGESSSTEVAWQVCGGDVPARCLDIQADTASCPGSVGSCQWYACNDERNTRANIERIECMADECGFDPTHDLECLRAWGELSQDCFADHCDPDSPSACNVISQGAWNECHR